MEIILLQDVDKLGTRGQVVKVANGFGRNYLLPKKLAVAATPQNRKYVQQLRVRFLKQEASEKADAQELAKLLAGASVSIARKAGEQGTLFGSVTAMDVAKSLAGQGYQIDKRKIQLSNPLKVLGEYDVPVKLHRDVIATVKVKVVSEGEPAAAPAEPDAKPAENLPARKPA